ncbi:MAG: protein kinase domain-containing protein [Planctomycetota bacterium]
MRLPSASLFDSMAYEPYQQLIQQIVARWRSGDPPDTIEALRQHEHLSRRSSAIAELASEEFHLRRARGEPLNTEEFCARFPSCASLVLELIAFRGRDRDCSPSQLAELVESLGNELVRWPRVGERWEGVRIIEELGQGSFARVYLAEELREGNRPVVVKVSLRANAEAQIQGALFHPHIVPVLTAASSDHSDFQSFVMPYLGRRTVDDWIEERVKDDQPLSDSRVCDVLRIGLDVVEALRHIHSRGIAHNDVKPGNILLTTTGRAVLFDFNLASKNPSRDGLGGTIPYMAPERLAMVGLPRGMASPPLSNLMSADLFSLAAVLCQLVTGQLPYGDPPRELSDTAQAAWMVRRQLEGLSLTDFRGLCVRGRGLLELLTLCLDCRVDRRFMDLAKFSERVRWLLERPEALEASDSHGTHGGQLPNRASPAWRDWPLSEANLIEEPIADGPKAMPVDAKRLSATARSPRSKQRWWSLFQHPSVAVAVVAGALVGAALEEAAWTMESQALTWEELPKQRSAWSEGVGRWRTYWDPEDAEGWMLLGDGRLTRLEPNAAGACYANALRLGLDTATLRNNLGLAYCLQGRLEHAESAFASALERDPELHAARENRLTSRQTWEACGYLLAADKREQDGHP